MDMLIGCRLAVVTRLAWHWPGAPVDLTTGPVHLVVDDGRGLLFDGRSDWSLAIVPTAPGDESWRSAYHYDFDGGRWARWDASDEEPFASAIGGMLSGWDPERDEAGQLVGGILHVGDQAVRLGLWQGEVISYAAGRG
ncbi:hypothetical protein [Actinoplanes siamensis]|uniref:Uncharacterized protein n=1 Tax=Actinoplanes siamensis TaxID=1223317 RepID=A0A919N7M8_9ACTN|nr:hypothetical protein [Actinoplanes siamensis]GIF05974.1 hypothetical protein Asi03nite_35120 [Actinoplanes siamensis]